MTNLINVKNIDIFRNDKTHKMDILIFNKKDQKYYLISENKSYTKDEEVMHYMTNPDYTLLHSKINLSKKSVSLFHKFGSDFYITLKNLKYIQKFDHNWKIEEEKINEQKFQEKLSQLVK